MDAAQALADLTEISSQIEAAALADTEGKVIASTFSEGEKGERFARAAHALVSAVERSRGDDKRLVQLEAATTEGSLFVVRDDRHVAAAVTGPDPTSGLIFYDLKTCLRLVAEEPEEKPKRKPRTTRKKKEADEAS